LQGIALPVVSEWYQQRHSCFTIVLGCGIHLKDIQHLAMGSLARALVLFVVLLLGAVGGAWLSLTLATVLLEPAERNFSNVPFVAALVLLVLGLAFIARKVTGTAGLAAFVLVALLGAVFVGWMIL
jgi:hypothetical protein